MSTQYEVFRRGEAYIEINEHSTLLDIIIPSAASSDNYYDGVVPDLTSRELVTIAMGMLKVASYVDGDLVDTMKGQDPYVLAELRRALI